MNFEELVRNRRAVRRFLSTPLTREQISLVLEDAQWSPSNGNTQPWQVHIVSGKSKDELAILLREDFEAGRTSSDFWYNGSEYPGRYFERYKEMGEIRNNALGIAHDDYKSRKEQLKRQYSFFGAPHAAFLFMPDIGDNVRVAGDLGMYGQTFLLSLCAHGYAGIPQTLLGMHAGTIREYLKIDRVSKMLFGISFGYADPKFPAEQINVGRSAFCEDVKFYD